MSQIKIHCCETCHTYWTCETKWYRGEKGEENICCPVCHHYTVCLNNKDSKKGPVSKPK